MKKGEVFVKACARLALNASAARLLKSIVVADMCGQSCGG